MIPSPVFLVGAERSGSTLLRLMLDSHPDISFFEEFEFAVETVPEEGWPDLAEYRQFLHHDRVYQLSRFEIDVDLDYPSLVDSFLRQAVGNGDESVVGATIHFGFDKIDRIWPDARFIHLVRDPRDVAPSVIKMSWAGNVWYALDKWLDAEVTWHELSQRLEPDRHVEVRFADLVADHERALTRICRFLGVDYSDQMLSYAADTDYDVPDARHNESWRSSLTDREVRLIETRVGPHLERLGFAPSGLPPIDLTNLERGRIRLDNKLRRPVHRAARIGWPLVLAETVTRVLHWDSGYRAVRRRSHAKVNERRRRSWRTSSPVSGAGA